MIPFLENVPVKAPRKRGLNLPEYSIFTVIQAIEGHYVPADLFSQPGNLTFGQLARRRNRFIDHLLM